MQLTASVLSLSAILATTTALGINCRGSGLCPRATLTSKDKIVQVLRDAVYASNKNGSTVYKPGDHVICISQTEIVNIHSSVKAGAEGTTGSFSLSSDVDIQAGGICLFTQGASLTLDQIRPLTDSILEHGCSTCGSAPIHYVDQGSNDPSDGILVFNYVENPFCDHECISDATVASAKLKRSAMLGRILGKKMF